MNEITDPAGDNHTNAHQDNSGKDLHPMIDKIENYLLGQFRRCSFCRLFCEIAVRHMVRRISEEVKFAMIENRNYAGRKGTGSFYAKAGGVIKGDRQLFCEKQPVPFSAGLLPGELPYQL